MDAGEPGRQAGGGEQRPVDVAHRRARRHGAGQHRLRLRRRATWSRRSRRELLAALRRLAQRHVPLGALCTGGYALAKAGLLDKYKAVIHWENMSALREEFPRVRFSDQLFAIDRDRYTCSGGMAPLDLMLNIIKDHLGRDIAPLISEQFILDRIRSDQDRQHIPLQARVGLFHENLIKAAALMEANIEEPLSLDEIAALVGVSRRQIERLFKRYVGQVPTKYYLDMRLRRARELLLQTSMSIMDIAVGLRLPVAAAFFQVLSQPVRPSRRARSGRGARRERKAARRLQGAGRRRRAAAAGIRCAREARCDRQLADAPTHRHAHRGRVAVVHAVVDARVRDFLDQLAGVGPAPYGAFGAGARGLERRARADVGLQHGGHGRRQDAVRARVFRVQGRVDEGRPGHRRRCRRGRRRRRCGWR